MRPAQLGVLVLLVFTLARGLPVPVLDEEAWLDIASQASWARPYDWWRAGPPWGDGHEASAFVFAPPPLFVYWVKLCATLTPHLSLLRVVAAAPFAALLGLSVGALAERGPRSSPAILAALSSPVLMLAAGCGLMPDLAVCALMMACTAAWLQGWSAPEGRTWWALSGGLLAVAAFTKYPALLLAPVLLLDAVRRGGLRRSAIFWLAFLAPWLAGEGWLAWTYGRIHVVEVLARSGEIPRGPWGARALGVLARLGLALCPVLLGWKGVQRLLLPAFLLGGGALALGWPAELGGAERALLLTLAAIGGAWVAFAADLVARGWRSVGPERDDTFVLAGLGLITIIGVVLGHNYASPRYFLPALVPLVLLACRGVSARMAWAGGAGADPGRGPQPGGGALRRGGRSGRDGAGRGQPGAGALLGGVDLPLAYGARGLDLCLGRAGLGRAGGAAEQRGAGPHARAGLGGREQHGRRSGEPEALGPGGGRGLVR